MMNKVLFRKGRVINVMFAFADDIILPLKFPNILDCIKNQHSDVVI